MKYWTFLTYPAEDREYVAGVMLGCLLESLVEMAFKNVSAIFLSVWNEKTSTNNDEKHSEFFTLICHY